MSSLNSVTLIGNLGGDPEVKFTQGGQPVANFSIATSEKWTDKATNEKKEKTEWHAIVVWGKTAELCGQYLAKGRKACVQGKLQTRTWDKDGVKHYKTEIVADRVVFLDSKSTGAGSAPSDRSGPPAEDDSGIPF